MDYSHYPRHDVLCIDMRSFYASVEMAHRGLDPKTALLAVVGDPSRNGSIVLAASPALKKKHGISNVSRYFELPNDPELVVAPARMGEYVRVSVEIAKMMKQIVPPEAIHIYSVDELWVTVDGMEKLYGSPYKIARMIQDRILEQFGVECAIGIGDNKFLAKVVMDIHAKKAEDGIAECRYEDVERLLWPVPIEHIWGIGSRMTRNFNRLGIVRLGQLAKYPLKYMKKHYGIIGEQLHWHAWGIDLSPVIGDFTKTEQKGFGHGVTLLRNYAKEEVPTVILDLCEEACRRARKAKQAGRTVHLSVGYAKETGGGFSRSTSVDLPTNITMDMYHLCLQLFYKHYDGYSMVRRISVTLTNLDEDIATQLTLFDDRPKNKDVGNVMDQIRDKYGSAAILRASSFTKAGITPERSKKIGGHYA
ncbi:DNA polymerase IV [Halobacillus salinus]|uniref:DNA polymerase IV n=1 Tax=Halobacillus salinus TaxID=192814 RepID=A0A4Z0H3H5_9BACI|nr:DNA polymerase IV [Halobacillus salinus]TGB04397.1 DNA polymerase IV [Halobacillus salinus]